VYSRLSGNRRFVEIELGFNGDRTLEHVHTLSRHMEDDLATEVPGLQFHIMPVWEPEPPDEPR
jgi:divalent metal cation (Fe/Co/Zn/Cd) transporter